MSNERYDTSKEVIYVGCDDTQANWEVFQDINHEGTPDFYSQFICRASKKREE